MLKFIKNSWKQALKIAIAGGLLYFLFHSGRLDWQALKSLATWPVICSGLLITGLVLYLAAERWRILLSQQKLECDSKKAFELTLIGTFFNFFVPGGVGGDVVKAVLIAQKHREQKGQAILTVLADRIFGLFTMVALALVSFVFELELLSREPSFQFIFLGLLILFFAFVSVFWILLSTRTQKLRLMISQLLSRIPKLQKAWKLAESYQLSWPKFLQLLVISATTQIAQVFLFIVVAYTQKPELPPLSVFFFAVPVGFMVTAVPLAPAGIGVGQAAFYYLFSKALGYESNIGVLSITAIQAFQLFYGIIGAFLFSMLKKQNPKLDLEASSV